jgi:hypothetical protein
MRKIIELQRLKLGNEILENLLYRMDASKV